MSTVAATMCHMPTSPTPPPFAPEPGDSVDAAEIGRRVLAGREAMRMSQQDFADAAGLSRAYMSRLERGLIPNPTITELAKIASVLGMTLAALVAAPSHLVEHRFSHDWDEIQRQVADLPEPLREMVLKAARQSIEIANGASNLARRN